MHDSSASVNPPDSWVEVDEEPVSRPGLAWLAVVLLIVVILLFQRVRPTADESDTDDQVSLLLMQMQARYFVGAAHLLGSADRSLFLQAGALNTGQIGQRLRFVVLAGELAGPREALEILGELDLKLAQSQKDLSDSQTEAKSILSRLYLDHARQEWDAPSLNASDRDRLCAELGWFGHLALAPVGTSDTASRQAVLALAKRTVISLFGILAGVVLVGFLGLFGLTLLVVLAVSGQLRSGLGPRSPFGGIYAETFALWMVLFFCLSFTSFLLPDHLPRLPLTGGAMLLSLAALAWPVLRGVPWHQVRQEIGLTLGRQPPLEPVLGFGCYAIAIPLLVIGVLATLILILVQGVLQGALRGFENFPDDFGPNGLPAHPLVELLVNPGWWNRVQLLLLASVVAPLVEETMFRGVLYRHLRETSNRLGPILSIAISGTLVSFIFAVIHPQGVVAVPMLMALAYAFTIAREWRGTLVPAMVAHGLNNGLVMLILVLAAGD